MYIFNVYITPSLIIIGLWLYKSIKYGSDCQRPESLQHKSSNSWACAHELVMNKDCVVLPPHWSLLYDLLKWSTWLPLPGCSIWPSLRPQTGPSRKTSRGSSKIRIESTCWVTYPIILVQHEFLLTDLPVLHCFTWCSHLYLGWHQLACAVMLSALLACLSAR